MGQIPYCSPANEKQTQQHSWREWYNKQTDTSENNKPYNENSITVQPQNL